MRILAIDPGNVQSACVTYYDNKPVSFELIPNQDVCNRIQFTAVDKIVIEMIASYGMPVGKTVFDTCVWIGKFAAWAELFQKQYELVYRKDIVQHICNNGRGKDTNIRQALIDRFGPPGTKKAKGLLYGMKKDMWAALAVAIYYADKEQENVGTNLRQSA